MKYKGAERRFSFSAFADRIRRYVDMGLIAALTELYYLIRLKPSGNNDLMRLRREGVDHIELRMFDLNPLRPEGIDVQDSERFIILTEAGAVMLQHLPLLCFPVRIWIAVNLSC